MLSSVARLGLLFVSADPEERAAAKRLKNEFQRICRTETDPRAVCALEPWQLGRRRLCADASRRDPRAFLTWEVIRETMFPPPHAAFARVEVKFLRGQDWKFWGEAVREHIAGLPFPSLFRLSSSSNSIHHGYHLSRFEQATHLKIRDFETILEFGGGYGSLCRIAYNIGFRGKYILYDLPEQSALQRYYLHRVGLKNAVTVSDLGQLPELAERLPGPCLFIATWSLSESPLEVREQIVGLVRRFDAYLMAYQNEFGGIQNEPFFCEWQGRLPDVSWQRKPIEHLPTNTYLFGVRSQ